MHPPGEGCHRSRHIEDSRIPTPFFLGSREQNPEPTTGSDRGVPPMWLDRNSGQWPTVHTLLRRPRHRPTGHSSGHPSAALAIKPPDRRRAPHTAKDTTRERGHVPGAKGRGDQRRGPERHNASISRPGIIGLPTQGRQRQKGKGGLLSAPEERLGALVRNRQRLRGRGLPGTRRQISSRYSNRSTRATPKRQRCRGTRVHVRATTRHDKPTPTTGGRHVRLLGYRTPNHTVPSCRLEGCPRLPPLPTTLGSSPGARPRVAE